MTGSVRIAEIFGIPLKVHWSFSLLILWVAGVGWYRGWVLEEALMFSLFILALFSCVILHEYGHALTARRFGVVTKDIILLPIAGIARLERLPEKPIHEFLVAVAGPLVNIAIAICLVPYFYFYPVSNFFEKLLSRPLLEGEIEFIPTILVLNLILAAFNLLPAFPLDGGRMLRSLLSMKMSRVNATKIASYIGQAFAFSCILWALLPEEYLPFEIKNGGISAAVIGMFIFFTARQEIESAKVDHILNNASVQDVMGTQFSQLFEKSSMEAAANYLKQGPERNFLVFAEDMQMVGTVNEASIIKAIKTNDLESETLKYTEISQIPAVYSSEKLKTVYDKLYSYKHTILPVLENGQIVGVIDDYILNTFLSEKRKNKKSV